MSSTPAPRPAPENLSPAARLAGWMTSLLLALILNVNGLRVATGQKTTLAYALFILFGLAVVAVYLLERRKRVMLDLPLFIAAAIAVIWAAATMLLGGRRQFGDLFKFVASMGVAFLASQMSLKERHRAIYLTLGISALYSAYSIVFYRFIFTNYLVPDPKVFNYLDITLPIGLGLAISLSLLLMGTKNRREIVFYLACAGVQLMALMRFRARGNLMFPILAALILLVILGLVDKRQRARNLLTIAATSLIVVGLFVVFANPALYRRITGMFTSLGEELRVGLFTHYIASIANPKTLLLGAGFGKSRAILAAGGFEHFYPHNFILELVGELGLVGFALVVVGFVRLVKAFKSYLPRLRTEDYGSPYLKTFLFGMAGLLYYFMNYFKSYSIYDGYQLFIFVAFILFAGRERTVPGTFGDRHV